MINIWQIYIYTNMKNLLLSPKITIFFLLLKVSFAISQDEYPSLSNNYTKTQLDQLLQKYQNRKDTLGLAYTYWSYAKSEEKQYGLNYSPLTNLRKSMECFLIMKDSANFYNIRGALGSYFMDRPFIKEYAKEYIKSAVDYFRVKNQPISEIGHLVNLANIDIHENNFKNVKEILDRVEMLNKKVKDEAYEGRLHSSYSDYYYRIAKYDESLKHAEISYKVGKKLQIDWLEALSLYVKSKCYDALNNQEERLATLLESQKIVESNSMLIQLQKEVYYEIQNYYFKQKNFQKAYDFMNKARKTTEEIYFSKMESDVRAFSEYNLLEKQRMVVSKIALEKKLADIELDKLLIRQQMYIVLIILAILLIGVLTYAYFSRQRFNRLDAEKVKKNIQIETLRALINGQEIERLRISQELHDGLGTLLSRIKFQTENINTSKDQIAEMIDDACAEVRIISSNLQPNALTQFGLIRSIDDLILKQNSTSPNIIFQHFGKEFEISPESSLMIFRIIQELMTNALKHAEASEILIQIVYQEERTLTITVEDDGKGFDDNKVQPENNGWNNIRSRVNYLHGIITLHSEPTAGTSVTISIPFV